MYSKIAPIIGSLAIASLVSAVPLEKRDIHFGSGSRTNHVGTWGNGGSGDAPGYSAPSNGYYAPSSTGSSWGGAPSSSASSGSGNIVVNLPTADGFPNIANPSPQLTAIEEAAHGLLPNGPPPPTPPAADDLTSLRLIAFNELFEVAFFTELLNLITSKAPGFEYQDEGEQQNIINAITAVIAQEKEHTLNANNALAHFNAGPILPCQYNFPAPDLKTAISIARTFTDVVMGTLGDVQTHFGLNGDNGLIRGVAAVIGQEGEQTGFYRSLLGLIPSAAPFLTASAREFAFSALNQAFVVPGSCPNVNTIDLPVFGAISPSPQFLQPQDQVINFSFTPTGQYAHYTNDYKSLSLVYINQQNVPLVANITSVSVSGGTVNVAAEFPFNEFIMDGLTIGALVEGSGPFANISQVAAATQFGPLLIEVN